MSRLYTIIKFIFLTFISIGFGSECDTNPDIGRDGIALGWMVCEYPLGKEKFYQYYCGDYEGLTGVDVSVIDMPEIRCSTTNESGFTCTDVPKDSEISLSFKSDKHVSLLVPVKTGYRDFKPSDDDEFPNAFAAPSMFTILATEELQSRERDLDSSIGCEPIDYHPTYPDSHKGEIAAIVVGIDPYPEKEISEPGQPINGTIVTIKSETSKRTIHPIYTEEKGIPCYDGRNAVNNIGISNNGYALFSDLEPGDYDVIFDLPENENYFCFVANVRADRTVWGYRTDIPNQIRVPVEQGHSTVTSLKCYKVDNFDAGTEYHDANHQDVDDSG